MVAQGTLYFYLEYYYSKNRIVIVIDGQILRRSTTLKQQNTKILPINYQACKMPQSAQKGRYKIRDIC